MITIDFDNKEIKRKGTVILTDESVNKQCRSDRIQDRPYKTDSYLSIHPSSIYNDKNGVIEMYSVQTSIGEEQHSQLFQMTYIIDTEQEWQYIMKKLQEIGKVSGWTL